MNPMNSSRPQRLLDPGLCLTLRPMNYPVFFEMYRAGRRRGSTSTSLYGVHRARLGAERE